MVSHSHPLALSYGGPLQPSSIRYLPPPPVPTRLSPPTFLSPSQFFKRAWWATLSLSQTPPTSHRFWSSLIPSSAIMESQLTRCDGWRREGGGEGMSERTRPWNWYRHLYCRVACAACGCHVYEAVWEWYIGEFFS